MQLFVVLAVAVVASAASPVITYSSPESPVHFSSSSDASRYAAAPSYQFSASSPLLQAQGAIGYSAAAPLQAIHLHELPSAQIHYSELAHAPATLHLSEAPVATIRYAQAPQAAILTHAAPAGEIHLASAPVQYNPAIAYAGHANPHVAPLSISLIQSAPLNSAQLSTKQQYSNGYSLAPAVSSIQYSAPAIGGQASSAVKAASQFSDATKVSSSVFSNSVGQAGSATLKSTSAPALPKFSTSAKLAIPPAYKAQYSTSYSSVAPQTQSIVSQPTFSSSVGQYSDATKVSSSSVSNSAGQSGASALKIASGPQLKFSSVSTSSSPAYGAQYTAYAAIAPQSQVIASSSNLGQYSDASKVSSSSVSSSLGLSGAASSTPLLKFSSIASSPKVSLDSGYKAQYSSYSASGPQYQPIVSQPSFSSNFGKYSASSASGSALLPATPALSSKILYSSQPAGAGLSAYYSAPSNKFAASIPSSSSLQLSGQAPSLKFSGLNINGASTSSYKAGGALQSSGLFGSSGSQYAAGSSYQSLRPAIILRQSNVLNEDGTFAYDFASDDGISIESNGLVKNLGPEDSAQTSRGTYSYTAPDGTPITTNWWADETGFHVQGDHIPQSIASL
ncbi:Insect cuticle protein [Nesidiocoris tenuis]|nr:Insect cuticle protein [Nesidiocoris tenuis]